MDIIAIDFKATWKKTRYVFQDINQDLAQPTKEWLDTLTEKQILAVIAWHFRRDHFSEGSWIADSVADGHMAVLVDALLGRCERQGLIMKTKTIETDGITYIEPVPGATSEWYYGMDYEHGDLYEAEELFKDGHVVKGRKLCLVHFPDGEVFFPVPKTEGHYSEKPIFFDGGIYMLDVDFPNGVIRIVRFDSSDHQVSIHTELPLSSVKDCYNLQLRISPLTLSRQSGNELDIVWPEKVSLSMEDHDSFFLRDGEKLFFNRWFEEGEDVDYKYWEETIVRDLNGNVIEIFPGDVMQMPNGEMWYLK